MNARLSHVTTAELVSIYLKATNASVHPDTQELTVKKNALIALMIHALLELCAKMNQDTTITPVYADLVTLELIAMSQ